MKLNNIGMPIGANRKTKRRGRGIGSGHGKTSCRGHKGTGQRSGRGVRLGFEGGQMPLIRRLPKKGFTAPFKKFYQVINIDDLNRFQADAVIGLVELKAAGLIGSTIEMVKLLGNGTLTKAVTVKAHKASQSAVKKLQDSGSKIEFIKA